MKRIFFSLIALLTLFFSCTESKSSNSISDTENQSKSGGEITIPLRSFFTVERPIVIKKIESAQIYGQMFESLVKYNSQTLEIEPSLAESWDISEDGLTYTFTIRKNVYFHDNVCFTDGKGREMTPQDVVDMFYRVYKNDNDNSGYYIFQNTIVGGDDYYNGLTETISGISVEGQNVSVTLKEESNTFLSKLVTIYGSVVPKESYKVDKWLPVGTGPFKYNAKESSSELVVLDKNPQYWLLDSNQVQLPYLDRITYKYYEDNSAKMEDFWDGNLAYVDNVSVTKISEVLEERIADFEGENAKYVLESVPQTATTYLEFNMESKVLKDVRVRQALNYAIDRKKIVEKTLKNQAYEIGKYGITPPLPKVFKNYDFDALEEFGYTKNTEKAKQLLADAGYPNGKGFPTLKAQFKQDNDMYLIMSEIQTQLYSTLNINLEIEQVEFNQLLENNAMGTADIFENIWIGDFPSPEAFLVNFYGGLVPKDPKAPSNINGARYVNVEFDAAYDKGILADEKDEAMKHFYEAEKILMQNPPLIVLFYGESMWVEQSKLKNFRTNGLNYIDYSMVYLDKSKETDEETAETEEAH